MGGEKEEAGGRKKRNRNRSRKLNSFCEILEIFNEMYLSTFFFYNKEIDLEKENRWQAIKTCEHFIYYYKTN